MFMLNNIFSSMKSHKSNSNFLIQNKSLRERMLFC